jgi:signal transduction histidine kinase
VSTQHCLVNWNVAESGDTTQLQLQLEQAETIVRTNNVLALEFAQLVLATPASTPRMRIRAHIVAARCLIDTRNPQDAYQDLEHALNLARIHGDRLNEAKSHQLLGSVLTQKQDYNGALGQFRAAEQIFEELLDVQGVISVQQSMATAFSAQNQALDAITLYNKVISEATKVQDSIDLAKALKNLGSVYQFFLADRVASDVLFHRALHVYQVLNDSVGQAICRYSLGYNAMRNAEYELATHEFLEGLRIARAHHVLRIKGFLNCGLVYCYLATGAIEKADYTVQQARSHDSDAEGVWFDVCLAHVLAAKESYRESFEVFERVQTTYNELQDPLYRAWTQKTRAEMAQKLRKYNEAIAAITAFNAIESAELRRLSNQQLAAARARNEVEQVRVEAEVERLKNSNLQQAVEELQQHKVEVEKYMAFMAHELKSPLNNIRTLSDLMLTDQQHISDDERNEYSKMVHDISTRMANMINSELNRMKGTEEPSANLDVLPIIQHVIGSMKRTADAKGIRITYVPNAIHAVVHSTERRLMSIVENLLSNAIKFSPLSEEVFVSVRCLPTVAPSRVLLTVKDNGPGLSTADLAKMFVQFGTLTAQPTGGEHSSGIGLHYVQTIVQQAGGRIWCESEEGKGATFRVEMPLAPNNPTT